ncbi:hypothetical protein 1 [Beihai mantis shrimp virus 4]|uniref:hypothetical protein 1 n=1 Tax=Beihai mantis shrimp virus 4 TaxID=1922431 RepID=UPI000909F56F|nr:hypothetical protein 1 [Beihai mantis shrimp virus 4]APG76917.1 hypothetical protein 1 [Beihai mantis shrimp virus 4]
MIKRLCSKMHDHISFYTFEKGVLRRTETHCFTSFRKDVTQKTIGKAFVVSGKRANSHKPYHFKWRPSPAEMTSAYYATKLPFSTLTDKGIAQECDTAVHVSDKMLKTPDQPQLSSLPSVEGREGCVEGQGTLFTEVKRVLCPECATMSDCVVSKSGYLPYACNKCVSSKSFGCRRKYPFAFPQIVPQAQSSSDGVLYDTCSYGTSGIPGTSLTYTGYGDVFVCRKCSGMIGCWEEGDDPQTEHRKYFPNCEDSDPVRCCPLECVPTETQIDGKCSCCCTFNICRRNCKMFVVQKKFAEALNDPAQYVHDCVEQGRLKPLEYNVRYADDKYDVTVTSGHLFGSAASDHFKIAVKEAMRKLISKQTMPPTPPYFSPLKKDLSFPEVEGVLDIPTKTEKAMENVAKVSTSAKKSLSKIESHVGKFSEQSQAVLENLNALINKISAFFPDCTPSIVSFLKDFILGMFFSIMQKSLYPLVQSVISFALNNSGLSHLAGKLSAWLSKLTYTMNEEDLWHDALENIPESEGFLDIDWTSFKSSVGGMYAGLGSGMCAAIAGVLSFVAVMCYGVSDFSVMSFNKLLMQSSLVGRALIGVRSFKDVFFGIWDYVDNHICMFLYGKTRSECDFEKVYPKLNDVLHVMSYFHDHIDSGKLVTSNRAAARLLVAADNLSSQYVDKSLTLKHIEITARLKEARVGVKALIQKAQLYLSCGDGVRIPPVMVLLHGTAGCGKTELSQMLQHAVCEEYYPEVSFPDLMFSRKSENEYWDGIKDSHRVIVYDDAFQQIDTQARPNPEIMEFIRLHNSDPYQVHMSAVADKASTFVRPDFIFATTNVSPDTLSPKSIHEPDALLRRFDLKVEVGIDPKFALSTTSVSHRQRVVPDPRKVWMAQNPDKNHRDLMQSIKDNSFSVKMMPEVYLCDVEYTQAGVTTNVQCTYKELFDLIKQLRTSRVNVNKDKITDPHPQLPDDLKDVANRLETQGSGDYDVSFIVHPTASEVSDDSDLESVSSCYTSCSSSGSEPDGDELEMEDALDYFENHCEEKDVSIWQRCKTKVMDFLSGLKSLWVKVKAFLHKHWMLFSGLSFVAMAGVGYAIGAAADCRVRCFLEKGGTCMQLVGIISCLLPCDLCSRIKRGDITMRVRSHSDGSDTLVLVPSDVRRAARHIIQSAEVCGITVHPSFYASLLEEVYCVEGQGTESVSFLSGTVTESHQDVSPKVKTVESHQDVKPKTRIVEGRKVFDVEWKDLLHPQSTNDSNAIDVCAKILSKNLVRVHVGSYSTHGMFIKGRLLAIPRHLYDRREEDSLGLETICDRGNTIVNVPIHQVYEVSRQNVPVDLVICEMGMSTQARPDIVKYFPRKNELATLGALAKRGDLRLCSTRRFSSTATGGNMMVPYISTVDFLDFTDTVAEDRKVNRTYNVRQGLYCHGHTEKGDCGSPYVLHNPQSRTKILGLHSAGFSHSTEIYAQTLTQEDFENIRPETQGGRVTTLYPATKTALSPLPNSLVVGKVPTAPAPTKSSIVESPIHGCFPVTTAPAVLIHPTENILIKNSLKVTKNTVVLRENLIDVCVHDVKRVLNSKGKSDAEKRILTHEESIMGLCESRYVKPVNRSTSAGYPYSLHRDSGRVGKRTWLGEDEYIVDEPELLEHVETIIDHARRGEVRADLGIFQATLKDERRPKEKVEKLKTRVFAAANQALVLAQRRYFSTYLDHVMQNRITNEIGLGTNVYSFDWHRIVQRLQQVGLKVIAGDFSNFDGSLNSQLLGRIAEIVSDWYDDGEENALIRHVLTEYLFNAFWLVDGTVLQLNHSQPSGNPLTTLINCVYNMLIFRYIYLLALEENGYPMTLGNYRTRVASVFYGDDSICTISSSAIDWFNQHSITKYMLRTGHEYTDETKSGNPPPYRDISEVTFLKRGFEMKQGFWQAPLSKLTIEDMCMWSRSGIEPQEAMHQTTRIASFEASLHGEEYHNEFCNTVRRACRQAGFSDSLLHYAEAHNILLDQQGRGGALDSDFIASLLDM